MMRTVAILATVMAGALLPGLARAAETSVAAPADAPIIAYTRFPLRYSVRRVAGRGPQAVAFYITEDMGRSWRLYGNDDDRTSPMIIRVDGSGVYGFMSVVTDSAGNRELPPRAGTPPEIVVVVDRTPPTARWLLPDSDRLLPQGGIELAWEADDVHLPANPVAVEYSPDRGATWRPLRSGLPADGRFTWTPPRNAGGALSFRLIVRDRPGNTLTLNNPSVILLDREPPATQILGPTSSGRLDINVDYLAEDNPGGTGVASVQLWYTIDSGQTWEAAGGDPDLTSPIPFTSPVAGEVGLMLVATDEAGNASGAPHRGMAPPATVVFDTEPPAVEIDPAVAGAERILRAGQPVTVRWRATDANIEPASAALAYTTDEGATWDAIASGLPVNGPHVWEVPSGIDSESAQLRVAVSDRFGNVARVASRPFQIRSTPPRVEPENVRPIPPPPGQAQPPAPVAQEEAEPFEPAPVSMAQARPAADRGASGVPPVVEAERRYDETVLPMDEASEELTPSWPTAAEEEAPTAAADRRSRIEEEIFGGSSSIRTIPSAMEEDAAAVSAARPEPGTGPVSPPPNPDEIVTGSEAIPAAQESTPTRPAIPATAGVDPIWAEEEIPEEQIAPAPVTVEAVPSGEAPARRQAPDTSWTGIGIDVDVPPPPPASAVEPQPQPAPRDRTPPAASLREEVAGRDAFPEPDEALPPLPTRRDSASARRAPPPPSREPAPGPTPAPTAERTPVAAQQPDEGEDLLSWAQPVDRSPVESEAISIPEGTEPTEAPVEGIGRTAPAPARTSPTEPVRTGTEPHRRADAMVADAERFLTQGNLAAAQQQAEGALRLYPGLAAAHGVLARIHYARDDLPRDEALALAIEESREAIRYDDQHPHYWLTLGDALYSQARLAQQELDQRRKQNVPEDSLRPVVREVESKSAQARTAFQHVTEIKPNEKVGHEKLGDVAYLLARATLQPQYYQEAIAHYSRAYKIGEATYKEAFQIGVSYYRLKEYENAVRFLERAIAVQQDINPKEAYWYLALIHEQELNDLETALRYWEQTARSWEEGTAFQRQALDRVRALRRELGR